MTQAPRLSRWKDKASEQRFRAMEDELFAELGGDERPTSIVVPTRLGPTHVYRWDGRGEPVVLLHGVTGTALSWTTFAERRDGRTMYAIDTIGDVGRSRQEVAVESTRDLAEWLDQVLDGLGLDAAHLVGTSYGGFLALNLAVHRKARVRSLFLIDSAALVDVRLLRFMAWGLASMVAAALPHRLRAIAARRLRMPALQRPKVLRFVLYGQLHHRSKLLRPVPLTDEELRGITAPTHVVSAEKSEVFPSSEVVARAALLPDAVLDVIPDAGHAVLLSHLDLLADRLRSFLGDLR